MRVLPPARPPSRAPRRRPRPRARSWAPSRGSRPADSRHQSSSQDSTRATTSGSSRATSVDRSSGARPQRQHVLVHDHRARPRQERVVDPAAQPVAVLDPPPVAVFVGEAQRHPLAHEHPVDPVVERGAAPGVALGALERDVAGQGQARDAPDRPARAAAPGPQRLERRPRAPSRLGARPAGTTSSAGGATGARRRGRAGRAIGRSCAAARPAASAAAPRPGSSRAIRPPLHAPPARVLVPPPGRLPPCHGPRGAAQAEGGDGDARTGPRCGADATPSRRRSRRAWPSSSTSARSPRAAARPATRLAALMREADVLVPTLADRIDAGVIAAGAGRGCGSSPTTAPALDHIDLEAARAHGILVTNTPGVVTEDTADMTMALILAVTAPHPRGPRADAGGRLGRLAAARAPRRAHPGPGARHPRHGPDRAGGRPAGGRLRHGGPLPQPPPPRPEVEAALGATWWESLDQMVARIDVLSINCPHTPSTYHLVNARRLALMRPGAVVVNTSRGEVVDENALTRALRSGALGGAGLDVYESRAGLNPRLRELPNVVLLPHMGSATVEGRIEMGERVILNIRPSPTATRRPTWRSPGPPLTAPERLAPRPRRRRPRRASCSSEACLLDGPAPRLGTRSLADVGRDSSSAGSSSVVTSAAIPDAISSDSSVSSIDRLTGLAARHRSSRTVASTAATSIILQRAASGRWAARPSSSSVIAASIRAPSASSAAASAVDRRRPRPPAPRPPPRPPRPRVRLRHRLGHRLGHRLAGGLLVGGS